MLRVLERRFASIVSRRRALCAFVVLLTLVVGCQRDPHVSPSALVKSALESIREDDAEAFIRLVPTLSQGQEWCPGLYEKFSSAEEARQHFDEKLVFIRDSVRQCRELFDWEKAERVSVVGGTLRGDLRGCEGLRTMSDLKVTYRLDGREFLVTLRYPYRLGESYYGLFTAPSCSEKP